MIRAPFRFGLQGRMALTYVAVTAAAVLLVEAVAIFAVLPSVVSRLYLEKRVTITATLVADAAAQVNTSDNGLALPDGYRIGDPGADAAGAHPLGPGLAVPQIDGAPNPHGSAIFQPTVAVIIDQNLIIRASSYPARYPVGATAMSLLPVAKFTDVSAVADTSDGVVTYSLVPIVLSPQRIEVEKTATGKPSARLPAKVFIGWAYVHAPGTALPPSGPLGLASLSALAALPDSSVGPLLMAGAVLLLLLLPLGTAFGVWTSRGLVTRLASLATATAHFAHGDLAQRVTVGRADEVGQLERGFNEMATRIERMTAEQRRIADEDARTEERARIARELHDSISQDLFSVNLIAGGLQKALEPSSPLQAEIATMRRTIDGTMSEMRALLLELRPTALDERGLVSALSELCAAYKERLGVTIEARLDPVIVAPPKDHAVLRVAQEGIANAVRHSDARHIALELAQRDGHTELVVADDGRGFDEESSSGHGLGLHVMRERLRELGGSLVITSATGGGTRLVASIPS